MLTDTEIRINTVDEEQMLEHFIHCNTPFVYINIQEHARKLCQLATIIEIWKDSELAGLCACYMNNQETKIAFITHIEVHPEYKRLGFGRLIMEGTIKEAKAKDFNSIQLEVHKDNAPAIAFYNSLGFTIIEDRPSKYLLNLNI